MARSIVLSNGELAVGLDRFGEVRDLYFPHVGYEDHVRGHYVHRIGVWVDGQMSWLDEDPMWHIQITCDEDALVGRVCASNPRLQIELSFTDLVFHELPVFLRRVQVSNLSEGRRDIRLFFGQQFEIYKSHGGDTAYYEPASRSIIHYKGRRVFQVRAELEGEPFSDYAIGLSNFHGKEGAWRDADDGALSKNPIEHGPVDSIIGLYATYEQGQSKVCHYSLAAERSIALAQELTEYVTRKGMEYLMASTEKYWKSWVAKLMPADTADLELAHIALYKRSLMHARAHADQDGGVIASLDSDMLQYGLDTYSYVWPRDAAFHALGFIMAGEPAIAKRFFEFAAGLVTQGGYLMHKYLPDGSLGSSWHPWIRDGKLQLPIQEDETALVVYALERYVEATGDVELAQSLYEPLVERAGRFMTQYRDRRGLPDPSYDLWEEKRGISTFTSATVYAGLMAAAQLSRVLDKHDKETLYRNAAEEVRRAILEQLWDEKEGVFVKLLRSDGTTDRTLDVSSAYAVFAFGILLPDDARLTRAWEATARRLSFGIEAGGLARYEGDQYFRTEHDPAGNPWILTTLWYAEYLIARAKTKEELRRARDIFTWVAKHAELSGILPEQIDPKTGAPLSATPLAWSHAGYLIAVQTYLRKFKELANVK